MSLSTPEELRRRLDTLTQRIAAIDTDIGRETDADKLRILQERRESLAREREQTAAELALGGAVPPPKPDDVSGRLLVLENTTERHERMLSKIMRQIDPGPRRRAAVVIFWVILALLWSSWLVGEFRTFYLEHPIHACLILFGAVFVAFLIRWLPEQ